MNIILRSFVIDSPELRGDPEVLVNLNKQVSVDDEENRVKCKLEVVGDRSEIHYHPSYVFHFQLSTSKEQNGVRVLRPCEIRIALVLVGQTYAWAFGESPGFHVTNFRKKPTVGNAEKTYMAFEFDFQVADGEREEERDPGDGTPYGECSACMETAKLVQHSGCTHASLCGRCILKNTRLLTDRCPLCRAQVGAILSVPPALTAP